MGPVSIGVEVQRNTDGDTPSKLVHVSFNALTFAVSLKQFEPSAQPWVQTSSSSHVKMLMHENTCMIPLVYTCIRRPSVNIFSSPEHIHVSVVRLSTFLAHLSQRLMVSL